MVVACDFLAAHGAAGHCSQLWDGIIQQPSARCAIKRATQHAESSSQPLSLVSSGCQLRDFGTAAAVAPLFFYRQVPADADFVTTVRLRPSVVAESSAGILITLDDSDSRTALASHRRPPAGFTWLALLQREAAVVELTAYAPRGANGTHLSLTPPLARHVTGNHGVAHGVWLQFERRASVGAAARWRYTERDAWRDW